jgi:hypothetical protein
MTVISSNDFIVNQNKYFGIAVNEDVCIEKDANMFKLVYTNGHNPVCYDEFLEPDEDFFRAISMEELRARVLKDVHQWHKERNENNCNTGSTAIS